MVDEFDERNDNNTTYAVLFDGKLPVATARLIQSKTNSLSVRIVRVAILNSISGSKMWQSSFSSIRKDNYKK
ncbi:GNAT family N-acetyltransferase [Lactiplantibacillus plantarum]|uniref:hypothetical protein n=1 Tax=Lactiplantibacillus plantarum TaxID=1590 RepID=UPI0015871611|nr:hypothetical protein [Lactiplantibacillus plantarum]